MQKRTQKCEDAESNAKSGNAKNKARMLKGKKQCENAKGKRKS